MLIYFVLEEVGVGTIATKADFPGLNHRSDELERIFRLLEETTDLEEREQRTKALGVEKEKPRKEISVCKSNLGKIVHHLRAELTWTAAAYHSVDTLFGKIDIEMPSDLDITFTLDGKVVPTPKPKSFGVTPHSREE